MKIKAVFFDIDDTLYHFSKLHKEAMEKVLSYAREILFIKEIVFLNALSEATRQIEEYAGSGNPVVHNRQIRFQNTLLLLRKPIYPHADKMYKIYWNWILEKAIPEEGLLFLIRILKEKKIFLGIGTDMTSYIQNKKLEKLGLAEYFDCVVTSEESGVDKPSKKLFELCIRKAGCQPEECLFIGDNMEKDIKGAKAAGMQAVRYERYVNDETDTGFTSYKECVKDKKIQIGSIII